MDDFSKLKELYEDGYRCIYHDNNDSNYTIYLKNFDTENSEVLEFDNDDDFSQFKDYVDNLRTY